MGLMQAENGSISGQQGRQGRRTIWRETWKDIQNILTWIAFFGIALFCLFPILWGVRTSFAPRYDSGLIPSQFTIEHYRALFQRPELYIYLRNSLAITAGTIAIAAPVALLAAYALARFKFPGRQFGILFLVLPLLPAVAILVPLIAYMNRLRLYDTYLAVIIANTVFNMPFAIWMLRNFILANPYEIEEAALIDGCSRFQVLWRVAVPMMAPGLVAVIIFIFINSWNNYMYAFALTSSPTHRVLPQGVLSFLGVWGTYWGGLCALGILALIPPVVLFLLFQNWFVAGLFGQQLK
ncbi:MAG: carbohydrate ABC transporter permease [Firmicutes bacterium]|nr:carbohydrate ABC transporter permease [Bacillota bacterium]